MDKVRKFYQLTKEERIKIEVLLHQGWSSSKIAAFLQRSVSTVSREIKRNGPVLYKGATAQDKSVKRHRLKAKRSIFDEQMKDFISSMLITQRLSPELISVKGRELREDFISHEWIYRWIWQMKFSMRKTDHRFKRLYKFLKHGRRRQKRGNHHCKRGNIIDRKFIDKRPKVVEQRKRVGDLEADIVLGKNRKPGLIVVLERKTKKLWIRKLKTKDAAQVVEKLKQICHRAGNVRTITLDNDQSFARHYELKSLGIDTFFTHPYSSQEKGSVENRIGIIRMFFDKKTDFSTVSHAQVRKVESIINERPLRMFNYKTPNQLYEKYQPLH